VGPAASIEFDTAAGKRISTSRGKKALDPPGWATCMRPASGVSFSSVPAVANGRSGSLGRLLLDGQRKLVLVHGETLSTCTLDRQCTGGTGKPSRDWPDTSSAHRCPRGDWSSVTMGRSPSPSSGPGEMALLESSWTRFPSSVDSRLWFRNLAPIPSAIMESIRLTPAYEGWSYPLQNLLESPVRVSRINRYGGITVFPGRNFSQKSSKWTFFSALDAKYTACNESPES
jgi:hypothetical protein